VVKRWPRRVRDRPRDPRFGGPRGRPRDGGAAKDCCNRLVSEALALDAGGTEVCVICCSGNRCLATIVAAPKARKRPAGEPWLTPRLPDSSWGGRMMLNQRLPSHHSTKIRASARQSREGGHSRKYGPVRVRAVKAAVRRKYRPVRVREVNARRGQCAALHGRAGGLEASAPLVAVQERRCEASGAPVCHSELALWVPHTRPRTAPRRTRCLLARRARLSRSKLADRHRGRRRGAEPTAERRACAGSDSRGHGRARPQ
jgi:hypothetical protein